MVTLRTSYHTVAGYNMANIFRVSHTWQFFYDPFGEVLVIYETREILVILHKVAVPYLVTRNHKNIACYSKSDIKNKN